MAKATRVTETVVEKKKFDRVQLVLTEGEVDFLLGVLSRIGGDRKMSPRKYSERIYKALSEVTGQSYGDTDAYQLMTTPRSIYFQNYPIPFNKKTR